MHAAWGAALLARPHAVRQLVAAVLGAGRADEVDSVGSAHGGGLRTGVRGRSVLSGLDLGDDEARLFKSRRGDVHGDVGGLDPGLRWKVQRWARICLSVSHITDGQDSEGHLPRLKPRCGVAQLESLPGGMSCFPLRESLRRTSCKSNICVLCWAFYARLF